MSKVCCKFVWESLRQGESPLNHSNASPAEPEVGRRSDFHSLIPVKTPSSHPNVTSATLMLVYPTTTPYATMYMGISMPFRLLIAALFVCSLSLRAQETPAPESNGAILVGTVTDSNNEAVGGATVVLENSKGEDGQKLVTGENGFFEFHDLQPGIAYHVTVTAPELAPLTSPDFTVEPHQYKILPNVQLRVPTAITTVEVTQSPVEIATEEVKIAEKQRVFGIIPNFYVVYDKNPVPLTTKLKFRLAAKVIIDPVTALGVAMLSGMQQAGDTPDFGQGAEGYAKRFGANSADAVTDIMIGGAILPSLLHQDPRYFYQGTGSNSSRFWHAVSSPFICYGDNGKRQPNYSSLGGDLGSSTISNLYYPKSNRGVKLVVGNFAMSTGTRALSGVVQEFVLRKLTHRPGEHQISHE